MTFLSSLKQINLIIIQLWNICLTEIKNKVKRPIEFKAPGIITRQSVKESLNLGIKVIDAIIPLGKGQRELIIGDRQTGKSAIAADGITNQSLYAFLFDFISIITIFTNSSMFFTDVYSISGILNSEMHLSFLSILASIFYLVFYMFLFLIYKTNIMLRLSGIFKKFVTDGFVFVKNAIRTAYYRLMSKILVDFTNFSINIISCPIIEIVVVGFPIFLLVSFTNISLVHAYYPEIQGEHNRPDLTIKLTASQWYWTAEYPDYLNQKNQVISFQCDKLNPNDYQSILRMIPQPESADANYRLLVPTTHNVRMLVTSTDVAHGIFIPGLGIKVDAIPGRVNEVRFESLKPGMYHGACVELCGAGHGFMPITVQACHALDFYCWIQYESLMLCLEASSISSELFYNITQNDDKIFGEKLNMVSPFWLYFIDSCNAGSFWNIKNHEKIVAFLKEQNINTNSWDFINRFLKGNIKTTYDESGRIIDSAEFCTWSIHMEHFKRLQIILEELPVDLKEKFIELYQEINNTNGKMNSANLEKSKLLLTELKDESTRLNKALEIFHKSWESLILLDAGLQRVENLPVAARETFLKDIILKEVESKTIELQKEIAKLSEETKE